MALSNYDSFALDEQGRSTCGSITSALDIEVELYKTWLYIHDPKAWQEGSSFTKSIVMRIQEGELTYKDTRIKARRGPKQGVYFVVETGNETNRKIMIGIGCYGYVGDRFVGVDQAEIAFLRTWLNEWEDDRPMMHEMGLELTLEEEAQRTAKDADWFKHYTFPTWIRQIDLDRGKRFNQGDAYFADRLGTDTPATEPGKALPTMMSRLVGNDGK